MPGRVSFYPMTCFCGIWRSTVPGPRLVSLLLVASRVHWSGRTSGHRRASCSLQSCRLALLYVLHDIVISAVILRFVWALVVVSASMMFLLSPSIVPFWWHCWRLASCTFCILTFPRCLNLCISSYTLNLLRHTLASVAILI